MPAQPPFDQAPDASLTPSPKDHGPLFSFAHEAAPNPTDEVLAQAFSRAAAPPAATLPPVHTGQTQDDDPALKPGLHPPPDQVLDEELDRIRDRQQDQDQGFSL